MNLTEEELKALLDAAIRKWEHHSEEAGANMEQIVKIKNELGL